MAEEKSETHAVKADVLDRLTGNATEDGARTENGEVVTETETDEAEED